MIIDVITLFPMMFEALRYGIVGRAQQQEKMHLSLWNPRDYTNDIHHTVDDRPYGGGAGMVLKFEPLFDTLNAIHKKRNGSSVVIHLTPQGKPITQKKINDFALTHNAMILIAGRYEGIDERFIDAAIDEEWSVGDYVVSGGELPAMIVIDAITRQLPGVLGHEASAAADSFFNGLLDFPHYTRPAIVQNRAVPDVLLTGNHEAIARWRLKQALGRTWQRRQDLIQRQTLTAFERKLLEEYLVESEEST